MFFRLELNLNIETYRTKDEKDSITFTFEDEDKITLTIRHPNPDEQKVGHKQHQVFCTAVIETTPPDEIFEAFENLAKNKMPKGFVKPKSEDFDFYSYIDSEGNIKEKYIVGLELFPKYFQLFENKINKKLRDYIDRTIRILRWRNMLEGAHNAVSAWRGFFWAFDNTSWEHMPDSGIVSIHEDMSSPITSDTLIQIQEMVTNGLDEPLGHLLWREAWTQKERTPRSALVLGMVAIEVGFKQFVSVLLPQAQWLVENLPSPPIAKMLSDYLPLITTKQHFDGKVLPPPKAIRRLIHSGMEQRNKAVHAGMPPPSQDELEQLLLAIRDCLYLLDYYCGIEWALENIQDSTLKELKENKDNIA